MTNTKTKKEDFLTSEEKMTISLKKHFTEFLGATEKESLTEISVRNRSRSAYRITIFTATEMPPEKINERVRSVFSSLVFNRFELIRKFVVSDNFAEAFDSYVDIVEWLDGRGFSASITSATLWGKARIFLYNIFKR